MEYDVCILGGGAGAIGAGYTLKDSGLKVAIIEQNEILGGTHTAGMVTNFCPSPEPQFFKSQIYDYLQPLNKCTVINEEDWWKTNMCYVRPSTDGTFSADTLSGAIHFDRLLLADKYYNDLSSNLSIKLKTKFISASSVNGKCESIIVEDIETENRFTLRAKFFIDCSGGILCKNINSIKGEDYFVGSDNKELYNESCYDDITGDEALINGMDFHYRILLDVLNPEDTSIYPDVPGTGVATNGIYYDYTDTTKYRIVSPDLGVNINKALFSTTDLSIIYNNSKNNVLSSWKIEKATTPGYTNFRFDSYADMLGIREGWRIKCDNMITQDDTIVRITSLTDLAITKAIAVASWFYDFHGEAGVNKTELKKLRILPFGIPIGSLFPEKLKNVMIACRALGASHIASSATRITKTMMAIGYAAGFVAEDYVNNDRTDMRDVPVATIQTKVGIADTISYLEDNCYGKSYDTTWTP